MSTEDQHALLILEDLTKNHDVSVKIIDAGVSLFKRLKFLLKGISRTPRFVVNRKETFEVTNAQQLISAI